MKKTLLIFASILFSFSVSFSQFTISTLDGTPIENNDILTFNNTGDDANLVTLITNNSSSEVVLKLVAENISGTDGVDMEFCFGVCMWGITQGDIYGPLTINAGATTGDTEVHFHNHSTENDVITYNFKIYEEGNEANNFINFTYKYDVNYVGIDNVKSQLVSIYPNPATNYIKVKVEDKLIGSNLIITNILGKKVFSSKIGKSSTIINVSNLDNGIYFYSIIKNNKIIETKKLIIK